jgi:hypothetical protein
MRTVRRSGAPTALFSSCLLTWHFRLPGRCRHRFVRSAPDLTILHWISATPR